MDEYLSENWKEEINEVAFNFLLKTIRTLSGRAITTPQIVS